MAVNKAKLKTLNRLCDRGFDTSKKISSIEMEIAHENGLDDEIGGIIELKKAIRERKELAWLCDGNDPKPKEAKKNGRTEGSEDNQNQFSGGTAETGE